MRTGARLRERGRAISAKSLERSAQSASSPEQPLPSPLGTLAARWGFDSALETLGRARRRRALARRRTRRRHDASRKAPLEARSRMRSTRSRHAFPDGVALMSATNGKTTTTAMAARDPRRATAARVEPRRREPPLRDRVRLSSPRATAELGLFEVDEGALPEAIARTAPAGRRARRTSSATSSTATASSRSSPSAGARRSRALPEDDDARRQRRRPGRRGPRRRARAAPLRFGLDDPRQARPALQHAADSKYCVRCGAPYEYAAAYVGHLGDYRCPRATTRGRRSTSPRATSSSAGSSRRASGS